MRITGGQMKGRRLATLRGLNIRPTSDKVREAIFDLIGQDLTGVNNVLDLYAGTGSLGLEALSRGASWALFIDHSMRAVNLIKKNMRLCGCEVSGTILRKDMTRILNWEDLAKEKRFGLVFIDPPYGKGLITPVLEGLSHSQVLASCSTVVAESSKTDELPAKAGDLEMVDKRKYGETKLTLYRYEVDQ